MRTDVDGLKARATSLGATVRRLVEARGLVLLLLVALAGWAFIGLADETMEGDTHAFDKAVLLAFRTPGDLADPIGPGWLEEMMRDITGLGGIGILAFITIAVGVLFWLRGRRRTILYLLVSVGGGALLSSLAKGLFDRPRPDLVPHETIVFSASFPSGHSMMSAVVYLTLAALVARTEGQRRVKIYILSLAVLVVVAIGVSRVYLGVHWPSDVLAGWTAGAGWALLCLWGANWLARRGEVEPAATETTTDPALGETPPRSADQTR